MTTLLLKWVRDNITRGTTPVLGQYQGPTILFLGLGTPGLSPIWTLGPFLVTDQPCRDRAPLQRPENLGHTRQSTVNTVSLTHPPPLGQCQALHRPGRWGATGQSSENHFQAVTVIQCPETQAHPDLPDRPQTLADPGRCLVTLVPDLTLIATPDPPPPPPLAGSTGAARGGG